jgi:hypothetical protein
VSHAQYATVVILIAAIQFAWDFVARTSGANATGASALNYEIRKDAVKRESVVKAAFSEFNEVGYGAGRIVVVKLHGHVAFFGMDDCFFHGAKLTRVSIFNRRGAE